MMSRATSTLWQSLLLFAIIASPAWAAKVTPGLDLSGKVPLKSAGPMTFGPEGVLFVGDPRSATVFAISVDPADRTKTPAPVKFDALNEQIASLVGIKAKELLINDVAVQPNSSTVYISASRGTGPDAEPVIAKLSSDGKLSVLSLENVPYSKVELGNVPAADQVDRRGTPLRQESITDLQFVDNRLIVAGLSNEEFASKLRAITFPFASADQGTSVEIYHASHGQFETRSPVRTFVPFNVNGEAHLMAAYTCTPLVSFPLSKLKTGEKVRGTTVAELGNHNRPLDIIAYEKDGKKFLLLANNARGVMKVSTDNIAQQQSLAAPVKETAGLTYETIDSLKGVEHVDKLGQGHALLLVKTENGTFNLETVELP